MKQIKLNFGALCFPINYQLEKQGLRLPDHYCKMYKGLADELANLAVAGILNWDEVNVARKRITDKIEKLVTPLAGIATDPAFTGTVWFKGEE